jgi:hypothetical protein
MDLRKPDAQVLPLTKGELEGVLLAVGDTRFLFRDPLLAAFRGMGERSEQEALMRVPAINPDGLDI